MKIKLISLVICFALLPSICNFASEQQPIETIKTTIDAVLEILDNSINDVSAEETINQNQVIWENIKTLFDFQEISRKTLSSNWKYLSNLEKKTFSSVFGQFLGNIYISKIQTKYKNEKVIYIDQKILDETHSLVKTKLISNNNIIPIDYKLIKNENKIWKIYDVRIEGISLVTNYRSQFKAILRKETPAQLIERLNQKIIEKNIVKIN